MALGAKAAGLLAWIERRALVPLLVAAYFWMLLFDDLSPLTTKGMIVCLVLSLVFAHRLMILYMVKSRFSTWQTHSSGIDYLQLQILLVTCVHLLLQLTGGIQSPLYPLLFVVIASVGALEPSIRRALVSLSLVIGLELASNLPKMFSLEMSDLATLSRPEWRIGVNIITLVFFVFMSRILFSALAAHLRLKAGTKERELKHKYDKLHMEQNQDADRYRLEASVALKSGHRSQDKRRVGSLNRLKQRVHSLLVIVNEALRPQTVAFFLLDRDGQMLKLMDHITDERSRDKLGTEPVSAGKGVMGAILKNGHTISFNNTKWDSDRFCYYSQKVDIKTFMGVPILERAEDGDLLARGVLLADRSVDLAFGDDDERLMITTAQELLHSMDTERVLNATEKLGGLLEASEEFIRAVNLADVVDEVLVQVRRMLPQAQFAAIALRDAGHTWIAGVKGESSFERWREQNIHKEVEPNSLCSKAISSCTVLPATAFYQRSKERRQVFGNSLRLDGVKSLKCIPLKSAVTLDGQSRPGQEQAIGALVVASREKNLFPEDPELLAGIMDLLEILSNFGTIAIQNAQRFEQLERMATTDGLTGLHNHRRFKEMLDEEVKASLRYDRNLSMILSDIDFFKKVNDTYGHPMGDEVLRRVARVLSELARESDKVCRYGGEEFSIILPETDATGAIQLAERFREKIKEQEFTTEGKRFGVTLSLGVCTMPEFARHRQELIDRSDQALYHAKRNGRDRTVHYSDIAEKEAQGD